LSGICLSDKLAKMPLQIYNSLSDQKEPFNPVHEGQASLYVCGPTVYSDSHLGHAKAYVSFDVILRYLRFCGLKTLYVQNITDVGHLMGDADEGEDKLLKRARELNQEPMAVAESYSRRHFEAMDLLEVIRPDISPRATGHIPEQLEAIEKLLEHGLAYESNGSVYFEITKDPKYGELSNRKVEEMKSGARVKVRSEKRHPGDFALWKRAEPGHLMRWRDPFSGWGYPGWHTECVVMSTRYLGEEFDIHGGGMDLKFPHHECEVAQAKACNGHSPVNYWMHTNMLTMNGQRMSKSTGNYILPMELLGGNNPFFDKKFDANTVRFCFLQAHYRSVLDISNDAMLAAEKGFNRLMEGITLLDKLTPSSNSTLAIEKWRKNCYDAMNDDFNTPILIANLFEGIKYINLVNDKKESLTTEDIELLKTTLYSFIFDVLGIKNEKSSSDNADKLSGVISMLIEMRNEARANKNWSLSDEIRDRLATLGIELKDGKDGTNFSF